MLFLEGAKGELVWLKNWIHFLNPKENTGNVPYDGSIATCTDKGKTTRCIGTFRQQDFEPKFRYFLFGFFCEELQHRNLSLYGLNYTITVSRETNVTTCERIHHSTSSAQRCSKYSNFATFPNVFGDYSQIRASSTFDSLFGILDKMDTPCYRYLEEALCIVIFPPCLNISVSAKGEHRTGTIQAMCREMCQDFGTSCGVHMGEAFSNILYCEYFHYKEHSNTCFYQEVFCDKPDLITNGGYNIIHGNASFSATTTIEYLCNEGYTLEGAQNSTCLLSGDWSSKSQCTSTLNNLDSNLTVRNALLSNGTPLLTMLVCFSTIIFIVLKRHRRSKKHSENINLPKRNKENDAFVSYYSEESCPEQTFVRKVLSPKLELEQEDPFKLIIHERDFRAGTNIVTNIMNAIHNSNSALCQ